jgi:hypothetical protein
MTTNWICRHEHFFNGEKANERIENRFILQKKFFFVLNDNYCNVQYVHVHSLTD